MNKGMNLSFCMWLGMYKSIDHFSPFIWMWQGFIQAILMSVRQHKELNF